MSVAVTSNLSEVKDIANAKSVLRKYEQKGCEVGIDKNGVLFLEMIYEDNEDVDSECSWPRALLVADMPKREDYQDEESWKQAVIDEFVDNGDAGIESLLRELAPHLAKPLLILMNEKDDDGDCFAQTWYVHPDAKDVEILTVSTR